MTKTLPATARIALTITLCLFIAACTHVPFDANRPIDRALPAEDTTIARSVHAATGGVDGRVLLAPLADGNDALGARLRMIEQAERAIDIKTFLIKPDIAGSLIWLELYEAAERGVKVRLLYDDVFTNAGDDEIATLDAHPNVEIRTFNPLSRNSSAVMNFVLDFARVNRRMHNKAMIVDGALAVIGGRNIADEYYQINTTNEFADFDLLVVGQPVADLSEAFDLYWNDPWSVPISAFEVGDDTNLRAARDFLTESSESQEAQIYRRAVGSEYLADLRAGNIETFEGTARVVVDDPDKLRAAPGLGPFVIGNSYYHTLMLAQADVLVITPYFVPEDYGARVFEDLVARGVRVRIITNSLAATNHAYVHGGYAPYRNRLLNAGVEFFEVRADAPSLVVGSDTPLVLHSKLAIVDGRTLFVGSTNLDPRSIRQNSELGMVIDSPALAESILGRIESAALDYTYRVTTDAEGSPLWTYSGAGQTEFFAAEPAATRWQRLQAQLAAWLPVEWQL